MSCPPSFDIYADLHHETAHSVDSPTRIRIETVDFKRVSASLKRLAGRRPMSVAAGGVDPLADCGTYVSATPTAAFVSDGEVVGFLPVKRGHG